MDWVGPEIPPAERIAELPIMNKPCTGPPRLSQFMFCPPRKKLDQARLHRPGIISIPDQKEPGSFLAMLCNRADEQLEKVFGVK